MMALTDEKLRKVVNMLSDPMQAHAAAHRLASEAKERGVLVSDLITELLAPPSIATPTPPPVAPTFSDVSSMVSTGRRINHEIYGLQSVIFHQTAKAWLVSSPDDDDERVWLPKSECEHHGQDAEGRAIFIVPMWLARKKGFPL
jgi:hypothetical protein